MPKESPDPTSRCCFAVICFFTLAIGVGVGIVVGKYVICVDKVEGEDPGINDDPTFWENIDDILDQVDSTEIEEHLRKLSEFPHIAGKDKNLELGETVANFFRDLGLKVQTKDYEVLLSYPDLQNPNSVSLFNGSKTIYSSPPTEKILRPEDNKTGVVPPFLAYSPPGVREGDLVYVNYGRVEDYDLLQNYSMDVSGKIVLARYGKIFRGDIVHIASLHNASGVIIFSDPRDFHPNSSTPVYPNGWWLPPTGTQRGTIYEGDGDPLTPDYPATEFAYRLPDKAVKQVLPSIPAHAIDAEVAQQIFKHLSGQEVPEAWRGNMNVTYRFGSSFEHGIKIRLNVSTTNQKKKIKNVVGIIKGYVEPDRYVIIGNHRDAWVFGAMDPSSGTAIMMEMARVLSEKMKTSGWKPRRTILFCSWDAEEYGLIGSTEFVQDYVKTLTNRAVAYLNVDIAVQGGYTPRIGGSPLLYRTALSASSKVTSPNSDSTNFSLYQEWLKHTEVRDENNRGTGRPQYSNLGSGSDYAMMRGLAGVPVMDIRYMHDQKKLGVGSYPLYHSEYETFFAVKNYIDPSFKYHRAIGQLWLALATELSESVLLPFNLSDYAWTLHSLKDKLVATEGKKLEKHLKGYEDNLTRVISDFTDAAAEFMGEVNQADNIDSLTARRLNDQMLQLERAFLDCNGIPERPRYKHLIFAPSNHNSYASASFPGLVDLLYKIKDDDITQWERVKQHFSVILFTIQSASSTLRDVGKFV